MANEPKSATRLFKKAGKLGIPLHGVFELTPQCNMSCRMCYVRKTAQQVGNEGGLISADKWIEMGKQAKDAGLVFLLLTGGEPFTYPEFRRVYTELRNLGFMIAINSNATLLDEETVKWLASNPPYRMQITLYGASNETYARLCDNPQGFDQVIHALDLLKKYKIHFKLNATMTPANIDDLEEIYKIAEKYNAYVQATPYMFPPLRRDDRLVGTNFRFSAFDAGYYNAKIDRIRFNDELFKQRVNAIDKTVQMREECYNEEECGRDPYEPLGCRAGRSSFWLNWKGQMTACGMQNNPHSYPFRDGLIEAWNQIRKETEKIRLPLKCTECKYRKSCSVCGASVYCENGSINNEAPEYVCKMTESYIHNLKELYKDIE